MVVDLLYFRSVAVIYIPISDKVFAEITALKKENQAIKTEVAELRKLIQELTLKCSQVGFISLADLG